MIQWKRLLLCLAIPLAVGGVSAWLTQGSMEEFAALNQPPLSPPGWVFPVVWTILFLMMGVASYLVCTSGAERSRVQAALQSYALQLAFNFVWPLLFFRWGLYGVAFLWLIVLWVLILVTLTRFYRISKPAGWLLVPYALWVLFAGYLNLSIYLHN